MSEQTTIIIIVDGEEYSLDGSEFTARENGILKRVGHIGGVAALPKALKDGDLEAVVALAVIAMKRAGAEVDVDTLLDMDFSKIEVKLPESEPDPTNPAKEPGS